MVQTGTFDDLKGHNEALIRKMLEMAVFIWPSSQATISTIHDATAANLVIPDYAMPVGMTSKEAGAKWTPKIDISEVGAYGYGTPVRRDATSRTLDLQFTMLEARRAAFELYYGMDLSTKTVPSAKHELYFDQPDRPSAMYWRVLAIGRDGEGSTSIHHGEFLPKVLLTDVEPIAWSDGDPVAYGVTLSADMDSAYGTSQRTFWGGPGFSTALITAMGFSVV